MSFLIAKSNQHSTQVGLVLVTYSPNEIAVCAIIVSFVAPCQCTSPDGTCNHVPNLQPLRLFSLGANQARADSDSEDLAALVPVPEGACAWSL